MNTFSQAKSYLEAGCQQNIPIADLLSASWYLTLSLVPHAHVPASTSNLLVRNVAVQSGWGVNSLLTHGHRLCNSQAKAFGDLLSCFPSYSLLQELHSRLHTTALQSLCICSLILNSLPLFCQWLHDTKSSILQGLAETHVLLKLFLSPSLLH